MLPLQFFGQNLHFAISLFAALVVFSVFWLYFDAWSSKQAKTRKDLFKWLGFLLVSLSFVVHATVIEQSVLGESLLGNATETIATVLRLLGYLGIIIGLVIDPLQTRPNTKKIEAASSPPPAKLPAAAGSTKVFGLVFGLPLGAGTISALYWRRATAGLERHLRPVGIAFGLLFGFELLSLLANLWQGTTNPNLLSLVKPFGLLWIASHVLLIAGTVVLGLWVWRYLLKRFLSQLFMIFTSMVMIIFLLTTISFTFLLMRSIQNNALNNLQTAVSVLNYAVDSKKAETLANSEVIAQNPDIAKAVAARDHKTLLKLTNTFLASKKQSSLVIVGASGQVLLRAEDPDRWGDSISSDSLIRRALVGQSASTLSAKQDVLAPLLYIKTATPIRDASQQIVGAAVVGLVADNAFTDGIKNSTGLDSAVYAGNVRSATSFLAPDGHSRQIGIKEQNKTVNNTVLKNGQIFKGTLNILNRPFLAVYAPLKDADNTVVGMLFIGQPQVSILASAGRSIELTFLVSVALLILSIIPAYFVARYLAHQIR